MERRGSLCEETIIAQICDIDPLLPPPYEQYKPIHKLFLFSNARPCRICVCFLDTAVK